MQLLLISCQRIEVDEIQRRKISAASASKTKCCYCAKKSELGIRDKEAKSKQILRPLWA